MINMHARIRQLRAQTCDQSFSARAASSGSAIGTSRQLAGTPVSGVSYKLPSSTLDGQTGMTIDVRLQDSSTRSSSRVSLPFISATVETNSSAAVILRTSNTGQHHRLMQLVPKNHLHLLFRLLVFPFRSKLAGGHQSFISRHGRLPLACVLASSFRRNMRGRGSRRIVLFLQDAQRTSLRPLTLHIVIPFRLC